MLQRHRCSQKCVARCKTSPRRDQLRGVVGQAEESAGACEVGFSNWVWTHLLPPSCPPLLPPWTHLWRSATFQFGWGARREQRVIMLLLVSWDLSNNWFERQINWDSVHSIPFEFDTVMCNVGYIPYICHFFYTGKIFGEKNLHRKTPIFPVKSVKKTPLFRVKSVENANFSR